MRILYLKSNFLGERIFRCYNRHIIMIKSQKCERQHRTASSLSLRREKMTKRHNMTSGKVKAVTAAAAAAPGTKNEIAFGLDFSISEEE